MFENVDERLCLRIFFARVLIGDGGGDCTVELDKDLDIGDVGDCAESELGNIALSEVGDLISAY